MIDERSRNLFIVLGGSLAMLVVLLGAFVVLCAVAWLLMRFMNWGLVELGYARAFGAEPGPTGVEVLLGALLLIVLARLLRFGRSED